MYFSQVGDLYGENLVIFELKPEKTCAALNNLTAMHLFRIIKLKQFYFLNFI